MAAVQEPVEDCRGQDGVLDHLAPGAYGLVARDQQAALFVVAVHEMELQVGGPTLKRQAAPPITSAWIYLIRCP